jgi:hypothetical protein
MGPTMYHPRSENIDRAGPLLDLRAARRYELARTPHHMAPTRLTNPATMTEPH